MNEVQRFHCIGCLQALPMDRANDLFKTGFFRNEIPLGLCSVCSGLNFVKKAGLRPNDWYNRSDIQ